MICLDSAQRRPTTQEAVTSILNAAVVVGSRFSWRVAEDLQGKCLDHVLRKLDRYQPDKGNFDAWCRRVLHRLALDLCPHHARLQCGEFDDHPDPGEPTPADHDRFRKLRAVLDRLAAVRHRMRFDPYAVLLLHLRLKAARRLARLFRRRASSPGEPPSLLLAERLPWTDADASRRPHAGLPRLGDLWNELTPLLDRPPHAITGHDLVRLMISEGSSKCQRSRWAQWCRRASEWARKLLGDDVWTQNLAPILGPRT